MIGYNEQEPPYHTVPDSSSEEGWDDGSRIGQRYKFQEITLKDLQRRQKTVIQKLFLLDLDMIGLMFMFKLKT